MSGMVSILLLSLLCEWMWNQLPIFYCFLNKYVNFEQSKRQELEYFWFTSLRSTLYCFLNKYVNFEQSKRAELQ